MSLLTRNQVSKIREKDLIFLPWGNSPLCGLMPSAYPSVSNPFPLFLCCSLSRGADSHSKFVQADFFSHFLPWLCPGSVPALPQPRPGREGRGPRRAEQFFKSSVLPPLKLGTPYSFSKIASVLPP